MVLTVHVRRDRAADRHLAGAGRYRDEPAVRQSGDHELLEGDAGLGDDDAGGGVEADDLVQPVGGDDEAAGGLRRVVVAAAEAAGYRAGAGVGAGVPPGTV